MSWVELDGAGWRLMHGLVIPVVQLKFYVAVNSNEEQHLLAKLNKMG